MKKVKVEKGQVLHRKGDEVKTLEIVLSGGIVMTDGDKVEVRLDSGSMVGAIYLPGDMYTFDFMAIEDSMLATLEYASEDDLSDAVTSTPAIAPAMAAASMDFTKAMLDSVGAIEKATVDFYQDIKFKYNDYKFMCVKVGKAPDYFAAVEELELPEQSEMCSGWEENVCRAFCEQKDELKKSFYPLNLNFCVAAVMTASEIGRKVRNYMESAADFIGQAKASTVLFLQQYFDVKSQVDPKARGSWTETPTIKDALDVILSYAGVKPEIAESFKKNVKKFVETEDRRAQTDGVRELRKKLTQEYYEIYEAAFFKSLASGNMPIELKMFFLFGFVDEELAGAANTEELYKIAVRWTEDPNGHIFSLYEWLVRIFKGEAVPSKNEFDVDWQGYLRESVRTGTMAQKKADELLDDKIEMVRFEINNIFKSANRITKGQMSTFVPVFNAQDVLKPLDKSLASWSVVQELFDKVLDIDFSCFYRPALAEFPEFKIPRFTYNMEVKPYVILMPNVGSRGVMWQEIEGARRTTPAHMVLSVFHSEKLDETIVQMCAHFRWEMCRRIQGVRYTDISDRSLTSEYVDYLQFYKKNSGLSNEMKESVKITLEKARNNFKEVFVAEYKKYIQNEANGLPRLNKVARDILFRYCTLSKKYRQLLGTNPLFQPLIERWAVKQGTKAHTADLTVQKVQKMLKQDEEVPQEIIGEAKFLRL